MCTPPLREQDERHLRSIPVSRRSAAVPRSLVVLRGPSAAGREYPCGAACATPSRCADRGASAGDRRGRTTGVARDWWMDRRTARPSERRGTHVERRGVQHLVEFRTRVRLQSRVWCASPASARAERGTTWARDSGQNRRRRPASHLARLGPTGCPWSWSPWITAEGIQCYRAHRHRV